MERRIAMLASSAGFDVLWQFLERATSAARA
jgi:hypothetical protein